MRNYLAYFPGINFELREGRTFLPFVRRSATTPCRVARLFRKHENFVAADEKEEGRDRKREGVEEGGPRLKRNGVAP